MSDQETKVVARPQTIKETKWYRKPAFPWLIISHLVIGVACFISGAQMNQIHQNDVKAEAASMVTSLSKSPQQK
jgi:hypothetical protein